MELNWERLRTEGYTFEAEVSSFISLRVYCSRYDALFKEDGMGWKGAVVVRCGQEDWATVKLNNGDYLDSTYLEEAKQEVVEKCQEAVKKYLASERKKLKEKAWYLEQVERGLDGGTELDREDSR